MLEETVRPLAAGDQRRIDSRSTLTYLAGFGIDLSSEAVAGALPQGQSGPQTPPHGLVHEIISGTTFTAPRANNRRVHLYRIRPATAQNELKPLGKTLFETAPFGLDPNPNPIRWSPFSVPEAPQDMLDGMLTLCGNGSAAEQSGMAMHVYRANRSMAQRAFSNADGEMLFVLQDGDLRFVTELGIIDATPGELVIIPRGVKFRVELLDGTASGFVCENYGVPFQLPELGLIGSTGQANTWDFQTPVAAFEEEDVETELVHKYAGKFWSTTLDHSPFDVVAWRGNYSPCKYNMYNFVILGTLAFDHAEPSIFCALTSPSHAVAGPNVDFMIMPPRWLVAEHTFRPPTFHRNSVAEFLALIKGQHDGKASNAFRPGAASLHNSWAPHGPDTPSFEGGRVGPQTPAFLDSLVFMIESRFPLILTETGVNTVERERDYVQSWGGFQKRFQS